MNTELDLKIAKLLQQWNAPQPAGTAISQILMAAEVKPQHAPVARRRMLFAAPALAAAMVIALVSFEHRDTPPKNDPMLQQSALGVFSVSQSGSDSGDLP